MPDLNGSNEKLKLILGSRTKEKKNNQNLWPDNSDKRSVGSGE